MAPEHKFATAAKLCGEVLGGVADGLLPLEQCEEVLGDALRCLASKDIKVKALLTCFYGTTFGPTLTIPRATLPHCHPSSASSYLRCQALLFCPIYHA